MPHSDILRRLVHRVLIVTTLTLSSFYAPPAHASPLVVIGEVAWAGSSASIADEWIELWNLGDEDVSLAGFSLVDASASPIVFPEDAVIMARGIYIIANYSSEDEKSALAVQPDLVTTSIALSNSALRITLLDATSVEIDVAGDGDTPSAGTSGETKATMIRDGEMWITATSSSGFDEGRTDLGTPGTCDGCAPTSETSETATTTAMEDIAATSTEEIPIDIEEASSTDAGIEMEIPTSTVATTTLAVVPTESAVTSTEMIAATTTQTATTSAAAATSTTPAPISSSTPPPISPLPPPPPQYNLLRLNEVMPQPDGENEWIEIALLDPTASVALAGVRLHDATGKIYTFATGTLDAATPFLRVFLTSSRLNNAGDTVTLRDPAGTTLDAFAYSFSKKGMAWARSPDASGAWEMTERPTPGNMNEIVVTPPMPEEEEEVTEVEMMPVETVEPVEEEIETVSVPVETTKTAVANVVKKSTTKSPAKKAATKTTSKKAVSTKSKTAPTQKSITFDMINDDSNAGIRVSLHGTVGSPAGLVQGHGFVLLSSDGRGLMVRVPTSKKLPAYGTMLDVSGSLVFSEQGVPSLKLGKNDGWKIYEGTQEEISPRLVDLMAPAAEDAWSLVNVTGTVMSVRGGTVTLDLHDAEINMAIRSVLKYKTGRLIAGDTISVSALLEMSGAEPRLLPRNAEDIVIVTHAAPKSKETKSALPGWTPFGAAGIAIAGTEGFKHLRERRKRRSLEKILETAVESE